MKLKSMLLIAAMALVGGTANAQNTAENTVTSQRQLTADELAKIKVYVKELNSELAKNPQRNENGEFVSVKLDYNPACMVFVERTARLAAASISRTERALAAYKTKGNCMGIVKMLAQFDSADGSNPMKLWVDAGYPVKFKMYDMGNAFLFDVVFHSDELKNEKASAGLHEEAKAFVNDMNSVLKVESWKTDDDEIERVALDDAHKSIVFVVKSSELDAADMKRRGMVLSTKELKEASVESVKEYIQYGVGVLKSWLNAGNQIRYKVCDKKGVLLNEIVIQPADVIQKGSSADVLKEAQDLAAMMNAEMEKASQASGGEEQMSMKIATDPMCMVFDVKTSKIDPASLSQDQKAMLFKTFKTSYASMVKMYINSGLAAVENWLDAGYPIKYRVCNMSGVPVCDDIIIRAEDVK